jgi:predicted amidohydrolase
MLKNDKVSRRNFLKKSGAGAGFIGLGVTSSNLFLENANIGSPLFRQEKISPRDVWVMSVVKSGFEDDKDIITGMIDRIKIMSSYKADIICLPEVFTGASAKEAEEVPGPTTNRLATIAKELGSYIICPLHSKKDGKVYNSAVLIDRKGEIAGQYDKIHPVSVESEKGVTPGSSPPPVFKTDFGTIGIQICFDINWVEEWKSLKEQGAEIVFWPSAYPAGRMLPSYAWLFKYYVVGCSWRDPATIYDITGDLIASSGQYEHWAFARLNLEKAFLEITDYDEKLNEIKKKFGRRVLIRYYHDEDWVTIESRSPDLRISEVLEEYKLVPHWDYIKIEEKEQERYRNM